MQAAHQNNEPTNEMNQVGGLPSINPSFRLLDASQSSGSANCSPVAYRTPIGEALKTWAPLVFTAIVVPGGIVIALVMLVRRWYRNRAVRPATFA